MVLPISAYPELKQEDKDGGEHIGWAIKIVRVVITTKVGEKSHWLKEYGQTQTKYCFAELQKMILLSM